MRCRDSGEAEPPSRAARKAAMGTPITHRERMRVSRRTLRRPTSPTARRAARAHQRPVLKSPAVCQRYVTTAHGPPSFAPCPPTPTSKRPARTRSVSQNGIPASATTANEAAARRRRSRRASEHEYGLRSKHESPIRVRCDGEQDRCSPQAEGAPRAAVEGAQQEHERQEREEQEEAVHPPVDTVEEKDPATGDQRRRDQPTPAVCQSSPEERYEWEARDRKPSRDESQSAESEAEVRHAVGSEEVEGGASALPRHMVDDPRKRVPPDEECERFVLVRRPRHQLMDEERRREERDDADPEPERVRDDQRARREDQRTRVRGCLGVLCHGPSGHIFAGRLPA